MRSRPHTTKLPLNQCFTNLHIFYMLVNLFALKNVRSFKVLKSVLNYI